jgi:hypothetical protein
MNSCKIKTWQIWMTDIQLLILLTVVLQKLKLIPPHKSVQQKKGLQKKLFLRCTTLLSYYIRKTFILYVSQGSSDSTHSSHQNSCSDSTWCVTHVNPMLLLPVHKVRVRGKTCNIAILKWWTLSTGWLQTFETNVFFSFGAQIPY